jgi:hypothetical protein
MAQAVIEPIAMRQTLNVALATDDGKSNHDINTSSVVVPR